MKQQLYAEIKVKILIDEDKLPDGVDEADPYEAKLDDLMEAIEVETMEWGQETGVEILIED
jgi:hypothetical protein